MNLSRKIGVIQVTVYNFVTKLLVAAFFLVMSTYAARVLPDQELGKAQYLTWIVSMLWLFLSLGGANALQRMVAEAFMKQQAKRIKKLIMIGMITAVIATALAITAVVAIPGIEFKVLLMALIAVQFAMLFLQAIVQSLFLYRPIFWIHLPAIGGALCLLFWMLPIYGIEAYLWTHICFNLILAGGYVFLVLASSNKLVVNAKEGDGISLKEWVSTCAYFAGSAILAAALAQRPEVYVIEEQLGLRSVAEYGIALNVVMLIMEPFKMLAGGMQSYFAGTAHQESLTKVQFQEFFRHYSWMVIFAATALWVEHRSILTFLYTDTYLSSAPALQWLIPGIAFGALTHVIMHVLVGMKRVRFLVIQDIVVAVLFLVGIFGIQTTSITQFALVKTGTFVCSFLSVATYMIVRLKWGFPIVSLIRNTILSAFILFLVSQLSWEGIGYTVLRVSVAFACYALLSWKLYLIDRKLVVRVMNTLGFLKK